MLSEGAKTILRHFRDKKLRQMEYEYPATLRELFSSPEDCEKAEQELSELGYISLASGQPSHIPVTDRVRAAAITLEGERFIEANDLA